MTVNDLSRAALVMFAAREAGPKGSLEQMRAICYCIRNRVRAGWHNGDWIAVMENAHEEAAHFQTKAERIDLNNRSLQRLLHEVDDIYFSQGDAGADGIEQAVAEQKFWMFLDRQLTEWFIGHIIHDQANHPSHAQMGLMMFFE